ncbi:hypothetical protein AX774_g2729 [Zancudomyces culisetae]|uniref:Uncharacterized protein n=1 Tax=Zancudomyces culisetae TaxID=1213189 RepID=A0A1R1PS32_ZANCU|nr:hypothetical protein AX774_g2729 [Zancudomyces culisetae]|eukprot:OMH83764.1 hypothetical protein AX774_g2729 [Zancudomyces culisetae]
MDEKSTELLPILKNIGSEVIISDSQCSNEDKSESILLNRENLDFSEASNSSHRLTRVSLENPLHAPYFIADANKTIPVEKNITILGDYDSFSENYTEVISANSQSPHNAYNKISGIEKSLENDNCSSYLDANNYKRQNLDIHSTIDLGSRGIGVDSDSDANTISSTKIAINSENEEKRYGYNTTFKGILGQKRDKRGRNVKFSGSIDKKAKNSDSIHKKSQTCTKDNVHTKRKVGFMDIVVKRNAQRVEKCSANSAHGTNDTNGTNVKYSAYSTYSINSINSTYNTNKPGVITLINKKMKSGHPVSKKLTGSKLLGSGYSNNNPNKPFNAVFNESLHKDKMVDKYPLKPDDECFGKMKWKYFYLIFGHSILLFVIFLLLMVFWVHKTVILNNLESVRISIDVVEVSPPKAYKLLTHSRNAEIGASRGQIGKRQNQDYEPSLFPKPKNIELTERIDVSNNEEALKNASDEGDVIINDRDNVVVNSKSSKNGSGTDEKQPEADSEAKNENPDTGEKNIITRLLENIKDNDSIVSSSEVANSTVGFYNNLDFIRKIDDNKSVNKKIKAELYDLIPSSYSATFQGSITSNLTMGITIEFVKPLEMYWNGKQIGVILNPETIKLRRGENRLNIINKEMYAYNRNIMAIKSYTNVTKNENDTLLRPKPEIQFSLILDKNERRKRKKPIEADDGDLRLHTTNHNGEKYKSDRVGFNKRAEKNKLIGVEKENSAIIPKDGKRNTKNPLIKPSNKQKDGGANVGDNKGQKNSNELLNKNLYDWLDIIEEVDVFSLEWRSVVRIYGLGIAAQAGFKKTVQVRCVNDDCIKV